jgi:hypothetical protein
LQQEEINIKKGGRKRRKKGARKNIFTYRFLKPNDAAEPLPAPWINVRMREPYHAVGPISLGIRNSSY